MPTQENSPIPAESMPEPFDAAVLSRAAQSDRPTPVRSGVQTRLPPLLSLLAAFGLLAILLVMAPSLCNSLLQNAPGAQSDWNISWRMRGMTVGYVIQPRLLPTLLLVGASLSLAALLAAIASALAVLIQRLETAIAPLGALCKALGRLMLFGQATVPVYVLSAVLIVGLFAILPDSARGITGQTGQLSELLLALVVLAPALALFPGLLTGQTIACEVTRTRGHSAGRVRSALLKGAATLLEQTGGILGASAILEQQFGWPGLGRAFVNALMGRDYPVALRLVDRKSVV